MLPYLGGAIILFGLPTLYVAVLLLPGEDPHPTDMDWCRPIAPAQRSAWHDPLCAFSCLSVFWMVFPR